MESVTITEKQISDMMHALGVTGKTNMYDYSRNFFGCSGDDEDWEQLVKLGFAKKHPVNNPYVFDRVIYSVTASGIEFLAKIYNR